MNQETGNNNKLGNNGSKKSANNSNNNKSNNNNNNNNAKNHMPGLMRKLSEKSLNKIHSEEEQNRMLIIPRLKLSSSSTSSSSPQKNTGINGPQSRLESRNLIFDSKTANMGMHSIDFFTP